MTDEAAQESTYTMGYSDDFQQLLDRRSVHTHAALPPPPPQARHACPGLRLWTGNHLGPVWPRRWTPASCTASTWNPRRSTWPVPRPRSADTPTRPSALGDLCTTPFVREGAAALNPSPRGEGWGEGSSGQPSLGVRKGLVGDVTDLPFDDDSFDVAHGHAVLMHVPDTPAVLAEVKRVLKPGRHLRQPRIDHFILVSPPRRRGDQQGLGHLRHAPGWQWRAS